MVVIVVSILRTQAGATRSKMKKWRAIAKQADPEPLGEEEYIVWKKYLKEHQQQNNKTILEKYKCRIVWNSDIFKKTISKFLWQLETLSAIDP